MKKKKALKVIDRIFGFFLAAGIVIGLSCLALEYIIVKGPSEKLKETFVVTMRETRRFGFLNYVFLSEDEVNDIAHRHYFIEEALADETIGEGEHVDISTVSTMSEYEELRAKIEAEFGVKDDDDDGIIVCDVKGTGYSGYMLLVLDPKQVILGKIDNFGSSYIGLTVPEMCEKYGAIAGMNAGGFEDPSGQGWGGEPTGPIYSQGTRYHEQSRKQMVTLDINGRMNIDSYTPEEADEAQIMNGTSFGPALIRNGVSMDANGMLSGTSPRTCIGQREDGVILMCAIDGRQAHSLGATFSDMLDVMTEFGAVNAYNMDGGSSTVMVLHNEIINSPSAKQLRPNPTAWIVLPREAE